MDRPTSIENHFQVLHRKTQRHLTESARSWILYRGRDWIDTETEKFDLMCPVKWKSIYFVTLLLTNLRSTTVQSFEKFPRLFLLCILLYAIRFTLQSATRRYSPRISWIFKSPRGLNYRTRAFISRDLYVSAMFPGTFEQDIVQKFICTLDRPELSGDHAARSETSNRIKYVSSWNLRD